MARKCAEFSLFYFLKNQLNSARFFTGKSVDFQQRNQTELSRSSREQNEVKSVDFLATEWAEIRWFSYQEKKQNSVENQAKKMG